MPRWKKNNKAIISIKLKSNVENKNNTQPTGNLYRIKNVTFDEMEFISNFIA